MKGEETLVVVGEILEEEGGTMGVVEEGTTEAVGEVTMGQWIMEIGRASCRERVSSPV